MSHWKRCFPVIGWTSRFSSCVCCCWCLLPTAEVWNAHRGKCARARTRTDRLLFSVSSFIAAHPFWCNVLLLSVLDTRHSCLLVSWWIIMRLCLNPVTPYLGNTYNVQVAHMLKCRDAENVVIAFAWTLDFVI